MANHRRVLNLKWQNGKRRDGEKKKKYIYMPQSQENNNLQWSEKIAFLMIVRFLTLLQKYDMLILV